MAVVESGIESLLADKDEMRRIVDAEYEKMGIPFDPTATAELAQQLVGECLRAHGIRPEDNDASQAIIAARDDY